MKQLDGMPNIMIVSAVGLACSKTQGPVISCQGCPLQYITSGMSSTMCCVSRVTVLDWGW